MPRPDPDVRPRMKLPVHRLQGQLHTELVLLTAYRHGWLLTSYHIPAGSRTAYSDMIAIGLVVLTYIRGCLLTL